MTIPSSHPRASDPSARNAALQLAAIFAFARLLIQFALTLYTAHIGYGYFRDEFYFLACGRHLAWGYVDQGPTVALVARVGEVLFGDSLFAIRVLPALAGAVAVGLTGLLTWASGGGRAAQVLAMVAVLLCPVYLATAGTLCIPCLEPMFWIGTALCVVLMQRGGSPRVLWLSIGALAGVGLLTKPSMLFFLASLLAGLLLTQERRLLRSRWFAASALLTLLIVAPFLHWEFANHWPTWEFLRNGQIHHKNVLLGPLAFVWAQVAQLNPATAFLWIPGVIGCFVSPSLKPYRWIAVCYLAFLSLMFALHAKDYYLAPIYPLLFATGAVALQGRHLRTEASQGRLIGFPVLESALVLSGLVILPMSSPVLRPYTWARYTQALHLSSNQSETEKTSILPQYYADRFGWDQLNSIVVRGYRALPVADRQSLCIFANNYGEAGSLEFLGRRLEPNLPPVISGHNNYWLWGMRGCNGHHLIAVVHDTPQQLAKRWKVVRVLGSITDPLAMPFEHKNIYLLDQPRVDQPLIWAEEKDYF